ncbi:MAG: hypothetical protein EXX96DRAFT_537464 [Benjaminiella poitrasii]|nr:MAG: hypothetical protein EXX96DRAFT_537464 [Benjaminiella poitrasii]
MNSNSQMNGNVHQWMTPSDNGIEAFNYMVTRPPGSVLPIPSNQQQHPTPSLQHAHQLPPTRHPEQPFSPPAQAHDYDHSKASKGGRAVIPSKRAAQNRAAQKAFRQRREQYIKDLETKAKLMDTWHEEMQALRNENKELRERIMGLENRIIVLTKGETGKTADVSSNTPPPPPSSSSSITKMSTSTPLTPPPPPPPTSATTPTPTNVIRKSPERSMSLPNTTRVNSNEVIMRRESASAVHIPPSHKRPRSESRLRHEYSDSEEMDRNSQHPTGLRQPEEPFTPVPLRAPNQTGFEASSYHPNDHTTNAVIRHDTTQQNEENKKRKLESPSTLGGSQPTHIGQVPIVSTESNDSSHHSQHKMPANTIVQSSDNAILLPMQHDESQLQYPPQQFWTNNELNGNNSIMTDMNVPAIGDFDLDFDFDPFFEDDFGPTITNNNEFLPNANSGQVLDDLFAMLQTRQRPQIPIVPTEDNLEPTNTDDNVTKLT